MRGPWEKFGSFSSVFLRLALAFFQQWQTGSVCGEHLVNLTWLGEISHDSSNTRADSIGFCRMRQFQRWPFWLLALRLYSGCSLYPLANGFSTGPAALPQLPYVHGA